MPALTCLVMLQASTPTRRKVKFSPTTFETTAHLLATVLIAGKFRNRINNDMKPNQVENGGGQPSTFNTYTGNHPSVHPDNSGGGGGFKHRGGTDTGFL